MPTDRLLPAHSRALESEAHPTADVQLPFPAQQSFARYLHRDCLLSDRWMAYVEAHSGRPIPCRAALFAAEHGRLLQGRTISWLVDDYLRRTGGQS